QPGDNAVVLVVDRRGAPTVSVSGRPTVNGTPYTGAMSLGVRSLSADGTQLTNQIYTVQRDAVTGAFTLPVTALPDGARSVELVARTVDWPSSDWPTVTRPLSPGANALVWDPEMVLREVVVSGVARWFDEPLEELRISVDPYP